MEGISVLDMIRQGALVTYPLIAMSMIVLTIIGERLWNRLSQEQPDQVSGLRALWISPAFSHCVFTASKDFDKGLARRFTELMLAMDPKDPSTAEAMRLEGTRKWVAGSQEGFQELAKALREESGCCGDESGCCSDESGK